MAKKAAQYLRDLEVKNCPVGSIHESPTNSRLHTLFQIRKISEAIKAFGFTTPIATDEAGFIIAGHGRLRAAKLLGMETVPVIRLTGLTEAQRRALTIADNKLSDLSSFDQGALKTEFEYLLSVQSDFVIKTAFDDIETDRILNHVMSDKDGGNVQLPEDDAPAVSQLGDLWIAGEHKLLNGSALDRANWERLLGSERIVQTIIDPPYNVPIAGNVSGLGKKTHADFEMASGEMTDSEFTYNFLQPIFKLIRDFSVAGSICHAFMDWRHARHVENAADGVFFEHKNTVVWVKSNAGLGAFYKSQHEFVLVFKVSKGSHINNMGLGGKGRVRTNIWQYPGVNVFGRDRDKDLLAHATVKNKKMIADALLDCSSPGSIVFDCFCGSGTLLSAAAQTGRRARAMEISPIFVDTALRRLMAETGLVARLDDGRTFYEAAVDRGVELGEDA